MSDLHIDDFYRDSARILAQLYRSFPRKDLILVEDISGPDSPDEYGLHSQRHQSCFGTAIWLAESGYIRYGETIRQEGMDQAVLTHKAFTLLSARASFLADDDQLPSVATLPPSVQEEQQSNIHLLRQALRSGESHRLQQVMKHLFLQARHHI